jgi:hypothetical protein
MTRIAFIGTREPDRLPREWLDLYLQAVRTAVENGCVIHSSGTPGAERRAAETALRSGGRVRVYLPWEQYEAAWVARMRQRHDGMLEALVFDPDRDAAWIERLEEVNPEARFLAPASLKLQARHLGLVAEADEVIALPYPRRVPRDPKAPIDKGSTALGIRVAEEAGIPYFDLSEEADRLRLQQRLGSGGG